ncbi:MAG: hypothetical protein IJY27_07880 [Clostridia bacterium]|nr:hypothetical protein [Clostridia bacterium]
MTWEIAVGLFTIVSAFIAVMKVVVRINKTLTTLDISVNRLNDSMTRQAAKNKLIFGELEDHEKRLQRLEFVRNEYFPTKPTPPAAAPYSDNDLRREAEARGEL